MGGIALQTSPQDLLEGHGFKSLSDAFFNITNGKEQKGLEQLSFVMRELFNINVTFKLVDSSAEYKFFGFRAFPRNLPDFNDMADVRTAQNIGKSNWTNNNNWIIEIDGKIKNNYSSKLLPNDLVYLFIFFIEYNLCNPSLLERAKMLYEQVFCGDRIDYRVKKMLESPSVRALTKMITLQRCNWVNFYAILPSESLLNFNETSIAGYKNALNKLILTYGTTQLVNRKIDEFDHEIFGVIEWLYDGINDLRYSAFRFRKNLVCKINAMASPTIKLALTGIYRKFNESVSVVFAQESAVLPPMKKNKEQIAIENAHIDNVWKQRWKDVCEAYALEYIDKNGFAMKADKQEIDELRVRVASIDSVNDKVFLLERLHKQYAIIDNALAMMNDPKASHKVRQTKTELLKLKDELDLIRELIFKAPAGRMRFGLFVQYPEGYEG